MDASFETLGIFSIALSVNTYDLAVWPKRWPQLNTGLSLPPPLSQSSSSCTSNNKEHFLTGSFWKSSPPALISRSSKSSLSLTSPGLLPGRLTISALTLLRTNGRLQYAFSYPQEKKQTTEDHNIFFILLWDKMAKSPVKWNYRKPCLCPLKGFQLMENESLMSSACFWHNLLISHDSYKTSFEITSTIFPLQNREF